MNAKPGRGAGQGAIVIQVPAELKSLADPLEQLIATIGEQIMQAGPRNAIDYSKVEAEIASATGAIERAAHSEVLSRLDVDAPRVTIGGKAFTRTGRFPGTYHTRCGDVVLERSTYRELGKRNAETVDAISLRAATYGSGWLPRAAASIAFLLQQGTCREAQATARQLSVLPYSTATLDRVAHDLGRNWVRRHADIEDQLVEELEIPEAATAVSMSIDRVAVPMEEAKKRSVGRPRKDAPKRPIDRVYRMAYCAVLTLHDKEGEPLASIRYGSMAGSQGAEISAGMAGDLSVVLNRHPGLQVALLADGAHEMWTLLERHLPPDLQTHQLIDFYHLVEKLAPAASVLHGVESAKVIKRWKQRLLQSSNAAESILDELCASGREHHRIGGATPIHDAITYLRNHAARMDYATARRRGLPIGSGAVEATCKTVVSTRMKRSGSRWKEETGEHIIRLRAVAQSDDRWDSAMALLHAGQRTGVTAAA